MTGVVLVRESLWVGPEPSSLVVPSSSKYESGHDMNLVIGFTKCFFRVDLTGSC